MDQADAYIKIILLGLLATMLFIMAVPLFYIGG